MAKKKIKQLWEKIRFFFYPQGYVQILSGIYMRKENAKVWPKVIDMVSSSSLSSWPSDKESPWIEENK